MKVSEALAAAIAGVRGLRVDSPAALDGLGAAHAEATGPLLVDVRINGEVVNPSSAEIAAALRGPR